MTRHNGDQQSRGQPDNLERKRDESAPRTATIYYTLQFALKI